MIEGPLYYSWIAARHSGSFWFFLGGGGVGKGKGELECAKVVVKRERLSNFLERSKLKMAATVEKYRTLAARSPSQ